MLKLQLSAGAITWLVYDFRKHALTKLSMVSDEWIVVMFDREVYIFILDQKPQIIRFLYQVEYIWVCIDLRKILDRVY